MSRKTTILEELAKPNPVVINRAKWSINTANPDWANVQGWTSWRDFTAENLHAMFTDVVESEWTVRGDLHVAQTPWDGEIFDEDELEHTVLSAHIMPPVNAALQHATRYLKQPFGINLGRAGRTYYEPGGDRRYKADWGLCSNDRISEFDGGGYLYLNLMPGDSKLSNKWKSSYYTDPRGRAHWKDPVRQILQYCIQSASRYGFIITDEELVVVRVGIVLTGTGIAATRDRRTQQPQRQQSGHSRYASTSTQVSQLSASMQSMSMADSSSSYQPPAAVDEYTVEYRPIPWSSDGMGKHHLTVRLALFYLACMSSIGDNRLLASYPSLDSSWFRSDGICIHNTTGIILKNPKRLEYPDPAGERGPSWVTFDDADGESVDYLTLESVLTLDIAEPGGNEYYYYIEEEQRVLVSTEIPIYDATNEIFGYFDGLVWTVGYPPEPAEESTSKSSKKHSKPASKLSSKPRKRPRR